MGEAEDPAEEVRRQVPQGAAEAVVGAGPDEVQDQEGGRGRGTGRASGRLFALATAGCSAGPKQTAADTSSSTTSYASSGATSSPTSYAPYVSATEASANDSSGSPSTYNLAFVISDGNDCTPRWNGEDAIADTAVKSRISRLTADSGTVRVSFGGASGKELAATCDSVSKLTAAYATALDAAGSSQADFDIEGDELTAADTVALRSKAIAALQKERPDLEVSFTLPVMPSGLDSDSLALLESANTYDVQVSTVNLMTMNYGESYAGDMGDYALRSPSPTRRRCGCSPRRRRSPGCRCGRRSGTSSARRALARTRRPTAVG